MNIWFIKLICISQCLVFVIGVIYLPVAFLLIVIEATVKCYTTTLRRLLGKMWSRPKVTLHEAIQKLL